jgi:hypothetical protein
MLLHLEGGSNRLTVDFVSAGYGVVDSGQGLGKFDVDDWSEDLHDLSPRRIRGSL